MSEDWITWTKQLYSIQLFIHRPSESTVFSRKGVQQDCSCYDVKRGVGFAFNHE